MNTAASTVTVPIATTTATATIPGISATTNMNAELCLVCGDRASGRHYGAISCEGCKGFFKRSIRKQLGYQCRGSMNCEVTKHHRNRCQFCRLQKCLASGMRSDSVQHERKPIVDKKEALNISATTSNGSSSTTVASGSQKSNSSPVYRIKQEQQQRNVNFVRGSAAAAAAAVLSGSFENSMAATSVFPMGLNIAEFTQTLMLATQQQQQQQQQQQKQQQKQQQQQNAICFSPTQNETETEGFALKVETSNNNNDINLALETPANNKKPTIKTEDTEEQALSNNNNNNCKNQQTNNNNNNNNEEAQYDYEQLFEDLDEDFSDGDNDSDLMDALALDDILQNYMDNKNCCELNALDEPLLAHTSAAFNLQAPALVSVYFNIHYVCETASRIIFSSVFWFKRLAVFNQLQTNIQIKLLRNAWPALLAIALSQVRSISMPTILTTLSKTLRQMTDLEAPKLNKFSDHIVRLQTYVCEMLALDVDDMEFALLRLAVLFNPYVLLRRHERSVRHYVRQVQLNTLAALKKHIIENNDNKKLNNNSHLNNNVCSGEQTEDIKCTTINMNNQCDSIDERYNSLLINLPSLNEFDAHLIEELFFSNLGGQVHINDMIPYILTLNANPTAANSCGI